MADDIRLRPGVPSDAPTLAAINLATEIVDGEPPSPAGITPYFRHLVERGRVVVAEARDGTVVGFGAAVDTGRSRHLADLFVLPDRQSHGIGRRLLDAVLGDARPRTTFASDDPRALPLYLRAGMAAWWPNLYLSGDPASLPAADPDLTVETAQGLEIAALEASWCGADRGPDVGYWTTLPDVRHLVVRRAGRIVGTGIGRQRLNGQGRWMQHAMAAPGEVGPAILLAMLHGGLAGSEVGGGCVPGPSPLVPVLLEAGFRIVDRDTFLSSDRTVVDPGREIVNTGFL
jgi:GNAT superfamily N-acetyltransferase